MTAKSEPGEWTSTHDLILTSGTTTVPLILCDRTGKRNPLAFTRTPINRNSLKMYNGTQKYADLEPPWTPVAQTDWSGGRGSKDFDKDESMYYDGYNINTCRPGEIILGPEATSTLTPTTTSNTNAGEDYVASFDYSSPTAQYFAFKFTAGASLTASQLKLNLESSFPAWHVVKAGIGDVAAGTGKPENVTYSTNEWYGGVQGMQTVTFEISKAVVNGTSYFIVVLISGTASDAYQESTTAAGAYFTSADGTNWTAGDNTACPYYLLAVGNYAKAKYHFFEYKGALYAVGYNDDGGYSKLYVNGAHGIAKSGCTTTSVTLLGNHEYAADEFNDCILKIVTGGGSGQPSPYTTITDTAASTGGGSAAMYETVLTVDALDVAPGEDAILAIVASNTWDEVQVKSDATPYTFDNIYNDYVTDVLSVNGAVYFACTDAAVIKRMYAYVSGHKFIYNFSEPATDIVGSVAETGQFYYLTAFSDESGNYIMGAKGRYPAQTAKAPIIDYSALTGSGEAALVFDTAINCGDLWHRINGLEIYGDYGNPHALKEDGFYYYLNNQWFKTDIREMANTSDTRNGAAHVVHGKYLYFSWHDTLMRYIEGYLDGIGPDKAEVAFPAYNTAGHFSDLVGYAGLVIGSIDAGINGTSSILAYNGTGLCELYRANASERIQSLFIQSIPGNTVDRLWASVARTLVWLPISVDPFNHPDTSYNFSTSGYLITPWYYIGLNSVDKLFNSLKLVIENTSTYTSGGADTDYEYVTISYQVDDDTSWTAISNDFDSFSEEATLSSTYALDGKRIRFKFSLYSYDGAETPRIIASVLEAAVRVPNKYVTTVMCRLEDYDTQRDGAPDAVPLAITKFNNLTTMQALATPVSIQSCLEMIDGKYAFVDNVSPMPIAVKDKEGKRNAYAVSFSLIEVS